MTDRVSILRSLVALDRPLPEILESLLRFPWDSDEDLVVMTSEDIGAILDRFLVGDLSRAEVECWANSIESREDIGFEGSNENRIQDAINQLANPELSSPLTVESARAMRSFGGAGITAGSTAPPRPTRP